MTTNAFAWTALACAVVAVPRPAHAQQPPPAPAFVIESGDGDNRLQLGVLVQLDGRFTSDDAAPAQADTFLARRVRPIFQGRVARNFDYFFVLDLAATPYVRDAYFDTRLSNAFRVRAGKTKVPFGLERLHFANVLLFAERALPTALTPDRDLGVHVLGEVAERRLAYTVAVVNGGADGTSVEADSNNGKDLAARVIASPWTGSPDHPLAGLGAGVAATTGSAPASLPVVRSAGQHVFFSYARASGDGRRTRLAPQAYYYRGPFGGYAEYITSSGTITNGLVRADIGQAAWQVAASWVLTGEVATDRGVRPRANFDRALGRAGAVQVAARYHAFRGDRDSFVLGLAEPGASRTADAVTAGVNWYLNPFIKWVFNVERTVFDGDAGGARPAEHALMLRGQMSF